MAKPQVGMYQPIVDAFFSKRPSFLQQIHTAHQAPGIIFSNPHRAAAMAGLFGGLLGGTTSGRLVPALRFRSGEIRYGNPGELHAMIPGGDMEALAAGDVERGFAEPNGPFMGRKEALEWINKYEPNIGEKAAPWKMGAEAYSYYDAASRVGVASVQHG